MVLTMADFEKIESDGFCTFYSFGGNLDENSRANQQRSVGWYVYKPKIVVVFMYLLITSDKQLFV